MSSHLLLQPTLVMLNLLATSAPQVKEVNILSQSTIFLVLYTVLSNCRSTRTQVLPKTVEMIKTSCNGLTPVADLGEGPRGPGNPPYFG